jgi:hypothetical protein
LLLSIPFIERPKKTEEEADVSFTENVRRGCLGSRRVLLGLRSSSMASMEFSDKTLEGE